MNAVIHAGTCPVILGAVEPVVLHPRYHAMRVEPLAPEVGIYVLTPVAGRDRATFERDGYAGIVVAWIGDVMEEVDVDEAIAIDAAATWEL
jgi:hypothetical protein